MYKSLEHKSRLGNIHKGNDNEKDVVCLHMSFQKIYIFKNVVREPFLLCVLYKCIIFSIRKQL